jgi:hypothetical protein
LAYLQNILDKSLSVFDFEIVDDSLIQSMPNKTLQLKGEKCHGGKKNPRKG